MRRRGLILVMIAWTSSNAGCGGPSATSPTPPAGGGRSASPADAGEAPAATTVGGVPLEPQTALDGRLALLVPAGFSVMDEETLRLKYPSERRPTLVYTDEDASINVAVNHTKDRMPQREIRSFHAHMERMFRNLYPTAVWFQSGIIEIRGREWMALDLRTPAIDTEVRNIMVGTSLEGRLLLVSFNVTREQEEEWIAPAEAIVQSLRVRE